MTKLHFSAGRAGAEPPPAQRKVYAIDQTKLHPYPLCKTQGGGKGQKRKGLFS